MVQYEAFCHEHSAVCSCASVVDKSTAGKRCDVGCYPDHLESRGLLLPT